MASISTQELDAFIQSQKDKLNKDRNGSQYLIQVNIVLYFSYYLRFLIFLKHSNIPRSGNNYLNIGILYTPIHFKSIKIYPRAVLLLTLFMYLSIL